MAQAEARCRGSSGPLTIEIRRSGQGHGDPAILSLVGLLEPGDVVLRTLFGFLEFGDCSPAQCVPAFPSGLKAEPGAMLAMPGVTLPV